MQKYELDERCVKSTALRLGVMNLILKRAICYLGEISGRSNQSDIKIELQQAIGMFNSVEADITIMQKQQRDIIDSQKNGQIAD